MSLSISPVTSSPASAILPSASATTQTNFQDVLKTAIRNVEASSAQADTAVANYMSGNNQEVHSMVLSTQNADLNFEMFMQVRNKVVSAYEEIMRMQV